MNRRGGVAALIALAMATFVYLAYVSGVGNMYLPSESVASTTSSPVGRVAIPARIANPSPPAPAPLVDERPEPAPEPRASPAPTSPAVVRDDRKDEGRKLPMECPMVDVADPENVAAVARSLGDASDVVVFATQDIEHWRAEFLVNVILNLVSVNVTSVVTVGRHKHTCETARRDNPDVVRCCVYSTWLDGHDALKRWALAEDHAYVLWLIRYRFALDIMRAGSVGVLVSDSDMWFERDPFELLKDESPRASERTRSSPTWRASCFRPSTAAWSTSVPTYPVKAGGTFWRFLTTTWTIYWRTNRPPSVTRSEGSGRRLSGAR